MTSGIFNGLATAAAAIILSAAPGLAQETLHIGVSFDTQESSIQTAWEDYMRAEGERISAETDYDIEFTFVVANNDPATQASNIENLIISGVDVILARPRDSGAIGSSILAAADAGIPFFTFDRASSSDQPLAHVGGDGYDQAFRAGQALIGILEENGVEGRCIMLQGALTDENAVDRTRGWEDATGDSGVLETIVTVPTDWNPELFRSGLANALTARPDANCIFTQSDFAFPSIQAALEQAGRYAPTGEEGHMWLATVDLLSPAVAPMEQGYLDVSVSWDALSQAREAVRVAIALHEGEDPGCGERGCLALGQLVTPENVNELTLWSRDYQ